MDGYPDGVHQDGPRATLMIGECNIDDADVMRIHGESVNDKLIEKFREMFPVLLVGAPWPRMRLRAEIFDQD